MLIVAVALLLLQLVLFLVGYGVPLLLWFIFLALTAVNFILWRRDEPYQAGLQAERDETR